MLTVPAAEELYTVVENTTAHEVTVGFLGTRGMTLAANEVVAVPGDLVATLGVSAANGVRRHFDALLRVLAAGVLRINSRPAPVLYDRTDDAPKSLAIDNGVLGTVDPGYTTSGSVGFDAV